jgi:hypothetical protein
MLSAAEGIGSAAELPDARCRVAEDIEQAREDLCARIAGVIGKTLSREEIAALSRSDETLDTIRFEVDKALKKVAGWNMRK